MLKLVDSNLMFLKMCSKKCLTGISRKCGVPAQEHLEDTMLNRFLCYGTCTVDEFPNLMGSISFPKFIWSQNILIKDHLRFWKMMLCTRQMWSTSYLQSCMWLCHSFLYKQFLVIAVFRISAIWVERFAGV